MSISTHRHEALHSSDGMLNPGLIGRVQSYIARTRAQRQLQQLDDRLLADIGVARSEIEKMVWGN